MELRILELYSGIGGMHYAAKLGNVPSRVVLSLDINTSANAVYRHNWPLVNLQSRNIESLTCEEVNQLGIDVIMMSPPCQPFTRVGLKLDTKDERCRSFLRLVDISRGFSTVRYVLMENVVGFETSEMRRLFVESLKRDGFYYREFLMSPESIGVPNSRNRYYLLARKDRDFPFGSEDEISNVLPAEFVRIPVKRDKKIEDYLENLDSEQVTTHLVPEKTLTKYGRVLDIRQGHSTSSCCFTKAYTHYAEGTGSVLQHNTLQSLQDTFSEFSRLGDVSCLKNLQLRYFTTREVANLMGFPDSFQFPDVVTPKTRYRLLGNSLNVIMVANLFRLLML